MKKQDVLRLGRGVCEKLSGKIEVEIVPEECTLLIKTDSDNGSKLPKSGVMKLSGAAIQLRLLGISLPVTFLFFEEMNAGCLKGYIVPSRVKASRAQSDKAAMHDQRVSLYNAYQWLAKKAANAHAKSTSMDDRRAIAAMALWEAICSYTQKDGLPKTYFYEHIKAQLIAQNKQYTRYNRYDSVSLDASVKADKSGSVLYDRLPPRYKDQMLAAENKMYMAMFFKKYLSGREGDIITMLFTGYRENEILYKYHMTKQELLACCYSMGKRWKIHLDDSLP